MTDAMAKCERLSAILQGKPVDRPALSLWRHFYPEERAAETLVRRLAQWHRRFDFDFVKINVRAQYHVEGWGARFQYFDEDLAKPETVSLPVRTVADFRQIRPLDPWAWPLGEMLDVVKGLRRELGDQDGLVMTVFNPLSVAHDLIGGADALAAAIRDDPKAVHSALRAITDTFGPFAELCLDQGADGLFFATTHVAQAANIPYDVYEEFGCPYDMEILSAAKKARLNILHVCGPVAHVVRLADYPVQAIHWDTSDPQNPSLADMRDVTPKGLLGGLTRELFSQPGAADALVAEVRAARKAMGDRPFVLAATCTIGVDALEENIDAVCRAVRES